jgi:glycosyltransferase involved in cell wall biosynthesis
MSMSIIEAQIHGVPVIATDVGSTSEIVIPGITGFLVENNASAFENKIRDLLENQTLLKSFSHEGKISSKREFGIEKFVSRHSDLFSTVAS